MRIKPLALALVAFALVPIAVAGCSAKGGGSAGSTDKNATPAKVLGIYFDAGTKHGKLTSNTLRASGDTLSENGEFWVDGRKFRIDYFNKETGEKRISIVSTDGVTAYFFDPKTKTLEPSVGSVDHYMLYFERPGTGEPTDAGTDEQTGAKLYRYAIGKTEDMAGSSNTWYTKDITYLIKDGKIVGHIIRGGTPKDDGTEDEVDTFRWDFSDLETGMKLPADTFDFPYPVKNAD